MPITITAPFGFTLNTSDQSVYTSTTSYTPPANTLLLFVVGQKHPSTDITYPTISGLVNWALVATSNNTRRRVTVFQGVTGSNPGTEQITMTFAATMSSIQYSLLYVEGSVQTGISGSDAIVQSVTNSGTSGTANNIILTTPWASSENVGFAVFHSNSSTSSPWTAVESLTELFDAGSGSSDNAYAIMAHYGRNGTSLNLSATSSSSQFWSGLGFEIAAYVDETPPLVYPRVRQLGLNGRIN